VIFASILLPVVATQGQTAESFVYGAISDATQGKWASFAQKVEGAKWNREVDEAFRLGLRLSPASDIKTTSRKLKDYTLVTATYKIKVQGEKGTVQETVKVKNSYSWKIIPPTTRPESGLINYAAYMMVHGQKEYGNGKVESARRVALSSAKLICLSLLLYSVDNKGKLPGSDWQYKISKYIKDPEIYTPRDIAKSEWTFNSELWNKDPLDIDDNVVMVYVGSNKVLRYKFEDKGLVGFADGTAKFVTREEARKLKWR